MKENNVLKQVIVITVTALVSVMIFGGIINIKKEYRKAYNVPPLTVEQIQQADVSHANKLMIVAHPDDELLWGGGHLMDGGYLVLCVTRGYDAARSEEFRKVVEASGNQLLIMQYPDKVAGRRDNWSKVYSKIEKDLKLAVDYKNWDMIVTHNRRGEYGHIHHTMIHTMVTDIYKEENNKDTDLYFFGKYYRKSKIGKEKNALVKMSDDRIEFKNNLKSYYQSQKRVVDHLWHMSEYEMWEKYGGGKDFADV